MRNIAVLVFVAISLAGQAQYHSATHGAIHFQNRPQGYVTALPALPPESKLSFYLTETWTASDIYLKDSRVFGDEAQPWLRKTNPRNEDDLIALVRNLSQLPKS